MPTKHFWLRDRSNNPVACIATSRVNDRVAFAVAVCHPTKDRFQKSEGRRVAYDRLANAPSIFDCGFFGTKAEVLFLVLHSNHNKNVRRAAAHWLIDHSPQILMKAMHASFVPFVNPDVPEEEEPDFNPPPIDTPHHEIVATGGMGDTAIVEQTVPNPEPLGVVSIPDTPTPDHGDDIAHAVAYDPEEALGQSILDKFN